MSHANAPLTVEGRRRLCLRVDPGPPRAHVAAEAGVSRQCLSKWYTRWRADGEAGLERRRARLLELELHPRGVVVPANFTDTAGELVVQAAAEQGREGVVAKRVTSSYQVLGLVLLMGRSAACRVPEIGCSI